MLRRQFSGVVGQFDHQPVSRRLPVRPLCLSTWSLCSQYFDTGVGSFWVSKSDAVTSKDYQGGFKIQLMKKDISLAIASARTVGAKLALADANLAAYNAACEDPRCKDRDSRVVYRWLDGREDLVKHN
jgi:3-hydroxyisobutyrate/3-hydroxypropionate dehydrogenase